jgi:antibiotic biosynthesis monooxygenase (ABM) superfamily enzyme
MWESCDMDGLRRWMETPEVRAELERVAAELREEIRDLEIADLEEWFAQPSDHVD